MKKYSLSVICVVLFALLAGCGSKETSNITVDYGDSAVYTEQDMDDAIKVIEEMIGSWEGCELHSISYSSDDVCTDEKNLSWMNDLERQMTMIWLLHNASCSTAAFALRKRAAELGCRTRNTHGPGGWLAAMAGNGN